MDAPKPPEGFEGEVAPPAPTEETTEEKPHKTITIDVTETKEKAAQAVKKNPKLLVGVVVAVVLVIVIAFAAVSCSQNKVLYKDDNYTVTGYKNEKIEGKIPGIVCTVENNTGYELNSFLIDVDLYDKDGIRIGKTVGIASDVSPRGKAQLSIMPMSLDSNDKGLWTMDEVKKIKSIKLSSPVAF